MDVVRKVKINKTHFPIDGIYNYSVDVWTSVDGGKTFYYCGLGKHCRDYKEARRAKRAYERSF